MPNLQLTPAETGVLDLLLQGKSMWKLTSRKAM